MSPPSSSATTKKVNPPPSPQTLPVLSRSYEQSPPAEPRECHHDQCGRIAAVPPSGGRTRPADAVAARHGLASARDLCAPSLDSHHRLSRRIPECGGTPLSLLRHHARHTRSLALLFPGFGSRIRSLLC